jgi:DNA-binding transcriptional MocR family regulator
MPIQKLNRSTPGTLKDKLKGAILREVEAGDLKPGDRLPPTRQLAEDLGLNRGTVTSVYGELEEAGVLASHVGRGTFVAGGRRAPETEPDGDFRWNDHFTGFEPAPRERLLLAEAVSRAGKDLISFAGLVPDASFFPADAFRRALNAVLEEHGGPLLSYGPPDGHDSFLDFLRGYLDEERGVRVELSELLVVNGSQQALDLIARAFIRAGDTLVVEEPSYHGAMETFRAYGARLVGAPVDDEGIVVEGLDRLLARERPKLLYVMPTFQNPSGGVLSRERRRALVSLTARYKVPLIEDDFDGEMYYGERPPSPLKSLPESQGVIYIGTPSKMLFPGLRIGWVAAPEPVARRLSRIKQVADLSGSQLLQAALARFAAEGGLREHMTLVRRVYGQRLKAVLAALERHMPRGVTWTRPEGGLSILVTLPEGVDATELLNEAASQNVVYSPGRLFFIEGGANRLRLSFGSVPTERVDEGIRRLAQVVAKAMGKSARPHPRVRGMALPPV